MDEPRSIISFCLLWVVCLKFGRTALQCLNKEGALTFRGYNNCPPKRNEQMDFCSQQTQNRDSHKPLHCSKFFSTILTVNVETLRCNRNCAGAFHIFPLLLRLIRRFVEKHFFGDTVFRSFARYKSRAIFAPREKTENDRMQTRLIRQFIFCFIFFIIILQTAFSVFTPMQ